MKLSIVEQIQNIESFFKKIKWAVSKTRQEGFNIVICSKGNATVKINIVRGRKFVPVVEVEVRNKNLLISEVSVLHQHNTVESMFDWINNTIKNLNIKLKATKITPTKELFEKWYDNEMSKDHVPSWWPGHKMIF